MNVHHIAYAVGSVKDAAEAFSALGFSPKGQITDDALRSVRILFVENEQGVMLELVEPLEEKSPVTSLLKGSKGVPVPYHLCCEASDIDQALSELKGKGFVTISGVAPAPAIDGRNVVFCHSRKAGLVELVEGQ